MWPFGSTCEYCGDRGPEESCDECGRKFHVECAEAAGDLRAKQQVGDLLTAGGAEYHWDCPDCERDVYGET